MIDQTVSIRLAVPGDGFTIAIMSRELIEHGLGWSWTPQRVRKSIADRDTNVIVACVGKHVVGFAIAQYGEEQLHLSLLAVRTDYQRRGLGKSLLAWVEKSAVTAGIHTMRLEVRAQNQEARRFYRNIGFEEVALLPLYYAGREAAVRLTRAIAKRPTADSKPAGDQRGNGI